MEVEDSVPSVSELFSSSGRGDNSRWEPPAKKQKATEFLKSSNEYQQDYLKLLREQNKILSSILSELTMLRVAYYGSLGLEATEVGTTENE